MSAPFGGGFGQPNQTGFSQQTSPPQPNQGFGFGGGASAMPTQPTAPFSGGNGFPSTSFGSAAPPAQAPSFGMAAPAPQSNFQAGASNNASSNPFGTPPPAGQQQGPTLFGTANNPAPTGFGQPAASPAPFGQAPAFGSTNASNSGFGNPFGAAPPGSFPAQAQSNSASDPFGGQSTPQASVPNPFGGMADSGPSVSGPMMSFGVSSSVAQDSEMGSSSPVPQSNFGGNSLFSPGLPQPGGSMETGDETRKKPLKNLPFGTPDGSKGTNTQSTTSAWPSASGTSSTHSNHPFATQDSAAAAAPAGSMSPVMEDSMGNNDGNNATSTAADPSNDRLARLKAKLEQKKKKLEERKQKEGKQKQDQTQSNAQQGRTSPPRRRDQQESNKLNANAAAFVPTATDSEGTSLAEKNALRFATGATNQATRALLPQDLQNEAATDYSALRQTHTDAQALENATSLVGTCQHMCPDEELLRREREADIQLLEIVKPGDLHPSNWTLRDTCVKRFRRSAADYKLDVPEWVRPPEVLERVCSYLEEWVMERDRQGPDVRFSSGNAPPSLDVYQFIWDRTRMVRKDFILQNYVGTGGKCDAKAVRCHERIARWHAMCEHQLSHIEDFVVMQSQQNIQELGQTMKTLNQYYDDALGRSVVEEPDEDGKETASKQKGSGALAHGCDSNFVQGTSPVDFDGTPLKNSQDGTTVDARAIGRPDQHGTAEPEMSGLYILLTIDNDGGMEVLRYVAHLSRARPSIYRSRPVQLALSIYKTKKESNYAKFFQILRDPSTPYLFACIMFKHVALMRKTAFQVMYRAYGGKSKESNEAIYDHYPLRNLVRLLCFEGQEEALAACAHFGIKVRETKVRYSTGSKMEHIVFWKQGTFREPMDESKGTVLHLRPWKMVSTIESKLEGATRLAVCRGEKSGEGSFISGGQPQIANAAAGAVGSMQDAQRLQDMVRAEEQKKEAEKKKAELKLAEEKRREEEAARQREKEMEKERKRQEQLRKEKEAKEIERRRKLAEQQAAAKRKAEEEEKLRQEKIAELKRQEEAKRKAEEERKRKEELRRKQLEAEKKRQELLRQKRERERLEAERKKREEEERKRKEAERQRLQREAELRRLEEKRRAEQERKLALQWNARVDAARKKLSYLRWMNKFPCYLRQLDENDASLPDLGRGAQIQVTTKPLFAAATPSPEAEVGIRGVVESLVRKGLPKHIRPAASFSHAYVNSGKENEFQTPFLYRVCVVLPDSENDHALALFSLVQTWIGRALNFGSVDGFATSRSEFRVVVVDGNEADAMDSCDAALVVVPCTMEQPIGKTIGSLELMLKTDIPRVALLLVDEDLEVSVNEVSHELEARLSNSSGELYTIANSDLSEDSICDSVETAVELVAHECFQRKAKHIERTSIDSLCMRCITSAIFAREYNKRDDLVQAATDVLLSLVDELDASWSKVSWTFPEKEFTDYSIQGVPNYFGEGANLPLDWRSVSTRDGVKDGVFCWVERVKHGTFSEVLNRLLVGAPTTVVEECKVMEEHRSYRRAFQAALLWKVQESEPWQDESFVYLPNGFVDELIQRVASKVADSCTGSLEAAPSLPLSPARIGVGLWHVAEEEPADTGGKGTAGSAFSISPKRPREEALRATDEAIAPVETPFTEMTAPKKQRLSPSPAQKQQTMSEELSESKAYTRHLQALLSGDALHDQMVGNRTLSSLLRKAPKPNVELLD